MAGKINFPDIYIFLYQTLARGWNMENCVQSNRQTMFDESFHKRIFMILHIRTKLAFELLLHQFDQSLVLYFSFKNF